MSDQISCFLWSTRKRLPRSASVYLVAIERMMLSSSPRSRVEFNTLLASTRKRKRCREVACAARSLRASSSVAACGTGSGSGMAAATAFSGASLLSVFPLIPPVPTQGSAGTLTACGLLFCPEH
jgi:hypothetical protein